MWTLQKLSFKFLAFMLFSMASHVCAQDKLTEDSAALTILNTTRLVRKMDSTHRADSMRKVILLKEIESLTGSEDNVQRDLLLAKLRKEEEEDSMRKVHQRAELSKIKSTVKGYPVMLFEDTLFLVYTKIGSFSPAERASAISSKIRKIYDEENFNPEDIIVVHIDASSEIIYRDVIIMSVNELEALWLETSTSDLAKSYMKTIQESIRAQKKAHSVINILLRIGAAILIIIGIYVVIVLINKLFRKLNSRLIDLKNSVLNGIRFRGYQLLDSDRELQVALFLLNILRLIIIGFALYIALPLVFGVFPWTHGIANTLLDWVLTPLKHVFGGMLNYLPNLFTILVIVTVNYYVIKFLQFITAEIDRGAITIPGFYPDWAKPTFNIIRFLLYVFSFIIIFPYLPGSDSPIFRGVSVFVGILFSVGSSSATSNAVAGLVITYMRPFKLGDRIKIGEVTGDVIEKTLLVTRIRTIKNEDITIPNASVLSSHTINYTTAAKQLGLILHTSVTIGYDVPWRQVHELLIQAALATEGILQDEKRKPFVYQTSLDDFYVSYQINAHTENSHGMSAIYSRLHQLIQDKFNEAGVEIMSPHYRAARDGNTTTIPANYLPKDYQSPGFNVVVQQKTKEQE